MTKIIGIGCFIIALIWAMTKPSDSNMRKVTTAVGMTFAMLGIMFMGV